MYFVEVKIFSLISFLPSFPLIFRLLGALCGLDLRHMFSFDLFPVPPETVLSTDHNTGAMIYIKTIADAMIDKIGYKTPQPPTYLVYLGKDNARPLTASIRVELE